MMTRSADLPFGAQLLPDGGTRFRLWAPAAREVALVLYGPEGPQRLPMAPLAGADGVPGFFEWRSEAGLAGARYRFEIDGGDAVPDPASRRNPDDAGGASVVVDPRAHAWRTPQWRGRPWHEIVLYELHVGTFTAEGTFTAAAHRLARLAALGITAVEVMPVADFPGRRNWGYDGVLPFAPDAVYGTPEDFKRFIDTAHGLGLAVFLDVVYNHFGPEGNYLGKYAPAFFTARHHTPWGEAINFDGDGAAAVRSFYIRNALYWLDEYFLDGLRLDAVHAIVDDSPRHVLAEMADAVRDAFGSARHVHLVIENERNLASLLARRPDGTPAIATAQWNDDVHHALHCLLTGEADGYYADFADQPARRLATGLAQGFVYQGEPSAHGGGRPRGEPSAALPALAFVNFLQNHDQVGNRAFGERIGHLAPAAAVRAAVACVLLGPAVPLVFMGDEFDAAAPFLYFCDFEGELGHAVRDGRRREFACFARFSDPAARERIPDPTDVDTFERSRLDWTDADQGRHAGMQAFYRACLRARREFVQPLLAAGGGCTGEFGMASERAFAVRWSFEAGGTLELLANMTGAASWHGAAAAGEAAFAVNHVVQSGDTLTLGPWGVALFAG